MLVPDAALLLDGARVDHAAHPAAHAAEAERPLGDAQRVARVAAHVEARAERARVRAPELVCPADAVSDQRGDARVGGDGEEKTYTEERNGESLRSRTSSKFAMRPSPNIAVDRGGEPRSRKTRYRGTRTPELVVRERGGCRKLQLEKMALCAAVSNVSVGVGVTSLQTHLAGVHVDTVNPARVCADCIVEGVCYMSARASSTVH